MIANSPLMNSERHQTDVLPSIAIGCKSSCKLLLNKERLLSDVFIFPSHKESLGLVGVEALACGVPVVSTNAGGLPEVNEEGVTGYLCEVGDYKSMADKSLLILKDEEKLQSFRINARNKAIQFSKLNIVPQYEHLYKKCVTNS